jgi:hypothetical protein
MSSSSNEPLLDRIREQYAAFQSAHPQTRLYALIDSAAMPPRWRHSLLGVINELPRFSLYADTGLEDLSETGPFLIACPEPDGDGSLKVHRELLDLTARDYRLVSWLWSTHEVEPLVGHLQTLLHARLGATGDDVWFFFHQPAYLPVVYRSLSDEARRYMFGPCLAWWCVNHCNEMAELPGENLPLPAAWDALPIHEDVVGKLHQAGAPMQVHAWLQRVRPDVLDDEVHTNMQLQRLVPLVERAFRYGISGKVDQSVYAAYGLLYGERYDDHPALQAALAQFGMSKKGLIDIYEALGENVWKEVAVTARQRAAEAAKIAYQDELRERGYAWVRVWLVNDSQHPRSEVKLEPSDVNYVWETSLGSIDAGWTSVESGNEIASAQVPVPGRRVRVKWIQLGRECTRDAIVTGQLPRAKNEGLAIVTFARDSRVSISMHADQPDPAPVWWRLQQ